MKKKDVKTSKEVYNELRQLNKDYQLDILELKKATIRRIKIINDNFKKEMEAVDKNLEAEGEKLIIEAEQKAIKRIKANIKK